MKSQVPEVPATLESTRDSDDPPAPARYDEPLLLHPLDETRFAVGGERARGGIGRILEAKDELLGRRLALKQLLRADHPAAMARFMREAMITARLQHPSIVPVYDAGVRRSGEPFYSMPLVGGRSLYQAIHACKRLEERLALLGHVQAAADAIAYAHEQGIVHRDVKPSNVLVGPFGETVVIDWGLAKEVGAPELTPDAEPPAEKLLRDELGLVLDATRPGVARGTPGYMPPEQARGAEVDARSDVYALGAVLYHLLTGKSPGSGPSATPPPIDELEPRAPRDLVSIVDKAMAARPEDRYPSAKLFAVDLRRFATGQLVGARRYRPWTILLRWVKRHRVTAVAMAVMAVVTAAVAVPIAHRAARAPACGGDEALAARAWNPERAAAIRAQFERIGGAVAVAEWDRVAPVFTAYAGRWAKMRHESCVATRVRHAQSDSLFDKRQFCFDRRLAQLDATAASLATLESRELALGSREVAAGLPSLDVCATAAFVKDANLPPLAQRAAVDAAYHRFDAARALAGTGRAREALAALRELEPTVKTLAFAPLEADVELELGRAAHAVADDATAATAFERAEQIAAGLGRTDLVFEAEAQLMRIEAYGEHYERAMSRRTALEALAQLSPDPSHIVMHHENLGTTYQYQERHAEALAEFDRALALLPADGSSPREDSVHDGRGIALQRLRRYDEAEPELEHALAVREARHGANHPLVATSLIQLGNLALFRHRYDVALERYRRALAIHEAVAGGEDTADVALAVGNVAVAEEKLGDYPAALASYGRALALKRRFFGENHREVIKTLSNQSNALFYVGRYDEAVAAKREGLARVLTTRKPDDPALIQGYGELSEVELGQGLASGDAAARRTACTDALATIDKAAALSRPEGQRPAHGAHGAVLIMRARILGCLGRRGEARADAQRAMDLARAGKEADRDTLFEASLVQAQSFLEEGRAADTLRLLAPFGDAAALGTATLRADALFARGQALYATGHRADGVALAKQALAGYQAVKEARGRDFERTVTTWLAAREGR